MRTDKAPWHIWVVGVLALLFTAFGAYDYIMSQTGNLAYMEAAVEPYGIPAEVAVAYFSSFPVWVDVAWAIGVWLAVAGSVLILLRNRFAYPVFVVSLAGMAVSNAWAMSNPVPGMTDTTATTVAVAVVVAIMISLTLYARAMVRRGVLR
ncbi:hypothetical protein [Alteraurantiacibacter aquimixticola]|uniref:Uncharacterized protein n=1 Tax=Alteraurantiacibacter aquimixticola TaxID=2489173 RepID=A0A4T3F3S4_9SPHN|nr:hypothetical protein [Alteraurantiacibacter aquimixticola]TIX51411.1 hypothetical protein E5222_02820 [Alteraurantiacibacter aquimixticola]